MITKTKIVCTIGPSCSDEKMIRDLIVAGMDVARLNFSHGSRESHKELYDIIRKVSAELGTHTAILQDLCGPKIRLGEIPEEGIELKEGNLVALTGDEIESTPERLHVSYKMLASEMKPNEEVLIDDGLIQLVSERIEGNDIFCRVKVGGIVKSHKGVNLPGTSLSISALTEKDIEDVKFGMEIGVDFVALSFVRRASDIMHLKQILEESKKFIPIIAKIEKREAISNLDEILTAANGAMVARGDLGIETPIERVPVVQKSIIRKCNYLSKPVITATQMLDSMIRNPIPTRAEATDVANAILDGTDAVMLSGETASGKYPLLSVQTMDKIARETEKLMTNSIHHEIHPHHNVVDSISGSTYHIAKELEAKAIIVHTDSGRTARLVSRYKPEAPILAMTYNLETAKQLSLSWGVFPQMIEPNDNTDAMFESASKIALKTGIVKDGDLVVSTAGIPALVKGSTNMIKVDVLGHVFLRGTGVGPLRNVTGKVCLAEKADDALATLEYGDILVTKRLDDSFTKISNRAGGIITEEGGEGSYAEYFCEKFNIPGIVGVPNVMEAFLKGRIITLEPERGIIHGAK